MELSAMLVCGCGGRTFRTSATTVVVLIPLVQAVSRLDKHAEKLHDRSPNYSCSAGLRSHARGNQHGLAVAQVYHEEARRGEVDQD